jgi:hypothetical protein
MQSTDYIVNKLRKFTCRDLLISDIAIVSSEAIRIETKLMRSNGTFVDIFIGSDGIDSEQAEQIILSDFGTSWDYLLDIDRPNQEFLRYIAKNYDLKLDGYAFIASCQIENFLPSLLRLAQACVATSAPGPVYEVVQHRAVTQVEQKMPALSYRTGPLAILDNPTTLTRVVRILDQTQKRFEQHVRIHLRDEYEIQVDVLIRSPRRRTALMVVEHSPYEKVTMRRADHAFAIHTDLKEAKWSGRRYSVISDEDAGKIEYSDSLRRLRRVSNLVAASTLRTERLFTEI